MGKDFKLLLQINSESCWKISLSPSSQECTCSPLTAEYKSRQNRFRTEKLFGVERSSCKCPWLIFSFKVGLNTTIGFLFPFGMSVMQQNEVFVEVLFQVTG